MNLYTLVADAARRFADREAVRFAGGTISYGALLAEARANAGRLHALGVRPGHAVLMFSPNVPEYLSVFLACAYLGAVFAPVNDAFRERELGYILANARADVAIVHGSAEAAFRASTLNAAHAPARILRIGPAMDAAAGSVADRLDAIAGDDVPPQPIAASATTPVLIVYTSGSTAMPKGVLHGHASVAYAIRTYAEMWNYRPDDRGVVVPPMPWVFGLLLTSMAMLVAGSTIVLLPRFHPERALEAIEQHRATLFFGTMSMYTKIIDVLGRRSFDLASLRFCMAGGEPCPDSAVRPVEQRLGHRLIQAWALSENHPTVAMRWDDLAAPRGTAGRAAPETIVSLRNADGRPVPVGMVGEAYVSGPGRMLGYVGEPALTAERMGADGFVRTGDLLRQDADGFFFVVGRASDMIIRSGANIAPAEVETALLDHAGIAAACVVGAPDARSGESVVAFVVAAAGMRIDPQALQAHLATRLARYKIPDSIRIVDELPSTVAGKLDRARLKKIAAGAAA